MPLTPAANLPPVSTILVKLVAKFSAGSKFATGVVDTGGILPPVSVPPVANLELRISPRFFFMNQFTPTLSLQYTGYQGFSNLTFGSKILQFGVADPG